MATSKELERLVLKSKLDSIAGAGVSIHAPARPIKNYLWLLMKEMQAKKGFISSKQPIYDLRLSGNPLRQFSVEELTELVFRIGSCFKMSNKPVSRTIAIEPAQCQGQTLALLRGLGFNQLNLNIDATTVPYASNLDEISGALSNISAYSGFKLCGSLTLNGETPATFLIELSHILTEQQCMEINLHWQDKNAASQGKCESFLNKFNKLDRNLAGQGYLLLGDNTFVHQDHPDIRLLQENTLRYGPWGFYPARISDWLGIGVGADGMIAGHLFHNTTNASTYANLVKSGQSTVACWSKRPLYDEKEFDFIQQIYCHHKVNRDFFNSSEDLLNRLFRREWVIEQGNSIALTLKGIINMASICQLYGSLIKN